MTQSIIDLPQRSAKPRSTGRTHTLDSGMGLAQSEDLLRTCSKFLDLVKIGWGTALILEDLDERVALYRSYGVDLCLGGTLCELCHVHGRVAELEELLASTGITHVEVSDGSIELPLDAKLQYISRLANSFTVYSEVGSKDAAAIVSPVRWVEAIRRELDAGATHVILEGRESGTAGLYRGSGEIRMGLIDEILESGIDFNDLIFEAPTKPQQVYMIELLGANVNFGNIPCDSVVALETLRLGLRSDTLDKFHVREVKG